MDKQNNLKKAFNQHVELEDFFAGFSVKSPLTAKDNGGNIDDELGKIADEVKKCQKCSLSQTRTNTVSGEGSSNARIFFVGEAPGADEDACGKPFVGRAGQLLEKMIVAMGFQRSDVFIGNILKCRPPGNRDPKPDEIVSCIPYLKAQLTIIRPEIIVALGAHAARTLLDSNQAIGKLRGRFHDYYFDENAEPIKLMPTYHPAYLLRNYSHDNRLRVWEDLKKVVIELGCELPNK